MTFYGGRETHAIVMTDVSGKGVPAALFMVIGKTLELAKADIDAFVEDNGQFDDITMLCLEYKRKIVPGE